MSQQHGYSPRDHSIETRELPHAKKVAVYRNGNTKYPPIATYFNPKYCRHLDNFMDDITEKLIRRGWAKGTVKHIYGLDGKKIIHLDQIEDESEIVCAGNEPFEELDYRKIPHSSPRHHKALTFRDFRPGLHNSQYQQCRPKYLESGPKNFRINIIPNGAYKDGAIPVSISEKWTMDQLLDNLQDKLRDGKRYQIVKHLCTLNGEKVQGKTCRDLNENEYYIAADKHFAPGHYELTHARNFQTYGARPKTLPSNYRVPPLAKNSPNHSLASNPEYLSNRSGNDRPALNRRKIKHEKETKPPPVPNQQNNKKPKQNRSKSPSRPLDRPVKHKRTPEKKPQQNGIHYNDNDGGVFKAKGQHKDTRDARPVKDDRHTKVDKPIDQQKAEVVRDEVIDSEPMSFPEDMELNRKPSSDDDYNYYAYNGHQEEKIAGGGPHKNDKMGGPNTKAKANSPAKAPDKKKVEASDLKNEKERWGAENVLPPINRTPSPQKTTRDNKDDKDMSQDEAAAKIQAGFRGHIARKEVEKMKQEQGKAPAAKTSDNKPNKPEKVENKPAAPMNDTKKNTEFSKEQDEAAKKIQAGFRGHKARQEVAAMKAR